MQDEKHDTKSLKDEGTSKSLQAEKHVSSSSSSHSHSSDNAPHLAIDIKDHEVPSEPPPPFTPYEAEFFESSDGDIISHDHHLNEDGSSFSCLSSRQGGEYAH